MTQIEKQEQIEKANNIYNNLIDALEYSATVSAKRILFESAIKELNSIDAWGEDWEDETRNTTVILVRQHVKDAYHSFKRNYM